MLYAVMYADGQGTASNDQLVIAEHEILDGCPETGPYFTSSHFDNSTARPNSCLYYEHKCRIWKTWREYCAAKMVHISYAWLTWLTYDRWQLRLEHRPVVFIQPCLALPPLSSSSSIWSLPSIFLFTDLSSRYSWVVVFLCGLAVSTVAPAWQCSHHFFSVCVQVSSIFSFCFLFLHFFYFLVRSLHIYFIHASTFIIIHSFFLPLQPQNPLYLHNFLRIWLMVPHPADWHGLSDYLSNFLRSSVFLLWFIFP